MVNNFSNAPVFQNIDAVHKATMSPHVVQTSGAGKAYQSVAQSTAVAVQDATDHLRNMSTVSATAVGMAMAQLLADPQNVNVYENVINQAQGITTTAAHQFKNIGLNAADVLEKFPSN